MSQFEFLMYMQAGCFSLFLYAVIKFIVNAIKASKKNNNG